MKTSIISRIGAVLIALLFTGSAFAQEITKHDTLPTVVITAKTLINHKVSEAFHKDFENAVSPKWFTMDKNFLVKFMTKDQKNSALYNKQGYIIYHIAYGDGSNLPAEITSQIKEKYADCTITKAIHVNQESRSIWVVNLETKRLLILVREEDGELSEMERTKNASM